MGYDVVLVHLARAMFPMRVAKKALVMRLPLYVQSHGMLARRSPLHYLIDVLATGDILAGARSVLSLQEHEDGELRHVRPDCHLHRLANGIDQAGLPAWSPESTNVVLFVGRIHKRKRLPALIKSIGLMTARGSSIRLRVAGPDDGDLRNAQDEVANLGLQGMVEFLGPLSHEAVFEEMRKATCLALPSADEPFPRSVLEGLAIGIPALVTETCHIAPLLRKHGAALVTGESPESLSDGLSRLLLEGDLREDLSARGRELIAAHLNEAAVARRLESLFLKKHSGSIS
jgi:glycosyltransferase involved in cell wall biosynthesis